ncbi:MAG: DUF1643 domain-containing protein [Deltaproteobacteria bacterium]|nr:DUF1643 domain-containing protein [Deltaproteobacteria bacterium]
MKFVERKTILSTCRQYRYCLWRDWDMTNSSHAMFVGLNPSTADEVEDDPTIRRCVNYAKRWGYGALCMMNLFAYRATEPAMMKAQAKPVGADNDRWLVEAAKDAGIIVAAWGAKGTHLQRDQAVRLLLAGRVSCLGKTKDGHPKHPLYVKADVKPCSYA